MNDSETRKVWGRPAREAHRARTGFTLIEVLIALVILATGIVIVLQAFQTAASALERTRDAMRATHLIRVRLDDLSVGPRQPPRDGRGRFADSYADFEWEQRVAGGDLAGGLYRVTVEVWRSGSDRRYGQTVFYSDGTRENPR